MHSYYTFIALDLAAERSREADNQRLANIARSGRDGSTRRTVAVGLAALGRVVAATVRRLDECVADDLAESIRSEGLAPSH
jgi:hypothetical protein